MKKNFILSMLISFTMICSCQKQDSALEQQLVQRKVELDAREDALIEREKVADEREKALDKREKALAENEKSKANLQTISPDAQPQEVNRDAADAKAEREKIIQQFRALIPDPSQANSAKDRMTRDPRAQRQGAQQRSQSQKQYKLQQAQKAWPSGAAVSPAVQAATPTASPAVEDTSSTPSSTP
jgi:hypothetical protein